MYMKNYYKIKKIFLIITFKNTNKLVEDKKQILKTDPDFIIEKQQKYDDIEKLLDLMSKKLIILMI